MTQQAKRICELAHAAAGAEDAGEGLRALTQLREETDAFIRVHAHRALSSGRSFSDIARALGISRQAAHRRFRDLTPERRRTRGRPLVATDAARRVVRLARAEALAAGAPPGSEHVLLGVLRTESETAQALRYDGVTPDRARVHVRRFAPERGDAVAGDDGLSRIVKRAAQVALSRGDAELDVQPLLQAAVADADGGAKRTLQALAVSERG